MLAVQLGYYRVSDPGDGLPTWALVTVWALVAGAAIAPVGIWLRRFWGYCFELPVLAVSLYAVYAVTLAGKGVDSTGLLLQTMGLVVTGCWILEAVVKAGLTARAEAKAAAKTKTGRA